MPTARGWEVGGKAPGIHANISAMWITIEREGGGGSLRSEQCFGREMHSDLLPDLRVIELRMQQVNGFV